MTKIIENIWAAMWNTSKHLVLRKAGWAAIEGGHIASLDKTKYNAEGNADSVTVTGGQNVMQQANIINTITYINMNHNRITALERTVMFCSSVTAASCLSLGVQ